MDLDSPPQKVSQSPHLSSHLVLDHTISNSILQTQRSHEQNQERAFIAASRRGDRGIEARLQSARRASEVHELRTGKRLCVSEAIVLKEEMYEEVEEGFPRSYQLRGPHRRTKTVEMNSQVGAHPKDSATMAESLSGQDQDSHENEVNHEFAQYFPELDQIISRRWSTNSIFIASPTQRNGFQNPPREAFEYTAQDISYAQSAVPEAQSHSPESSPPELRTDADLTPPTLTTEFGSYPATPRSQGASVFRHAMPVDSFRDCNCDESVFAANLPPEAKMLLADSGQGDLVDPALYDQQWIYAAAPSDTYRVSGLVDMEVEKDAFSELYDDSLYLMNWDPVSQSKISADDCSWNVFDNDLALGHKDE